MGTNLAAVKEKVKLLAFAEVPRFVHATLLVYSSAGAMSLDSACKQRYNDIDSNFDLEASSLCFSFC
jgi:hypothetical protein